MPGAKIYDIPGVADEPDNASALPILLARSEDTLVERLLDGQPLTVEGLLRHAQSYCQPPILDANAWKFEHLPGPNITDKETVLNLAIMASDAYVPDMGDPAWFNLSGGFNRSQSFGWQTYGIRGHVFADQDNSTVVIAIKGTEEGQ